MSIELRTCELLQSRTHAFVAAFDGRTANMPRGRMGDDFLWVCVVSIHNIKCLRARNPQLVHRCEQFHHLVAWRLSTFFNRLQDEHYRIQLVQQKKLVSTHIRFARCRYRRNPNEIMNGRRANNARSPNRVGAKSRWLASEWCHETPSNISSETAQCSSMYCVCVCSLLVCYCSISALVLNCVQKIRPSLRNNRSYRVHLTNSTQLRNFEHVHLFHIHALHMCVEYRMLLTKVHACICMSFDRGAAVASRSSGTAINSARARWGDLTCRRAEHSTEWLSPRSFVRVRVIGVHRVFESVCVLVDRHHQKRISVRANVHTMVTHTYMTV